MVGRLRRCRRGRLRAAAPSRRNRTPPSRDRRLSRVRAPLSPEGGPPRTARPPNGRGAPLRVSSMPPRGSLRPTPGPCRVRRRRSDGRDEPGEYEQVVVADGRAERTAHHGRVQDEQRPDQVHDVQRQIADDDPDRQRQQCRGVVETGPFPSLRGVVVGPVPELTVDHDPGDDDRDGADSRDPEAPPRKGGGQQPERRLDACSP